MNFRRRNGDSRRLRRDPCRNEGGQLMTDMDRIVWTASDIQVADIVADTDTRLPDAPQGWGACEATWCNDTVRTPRGDEQVRCTRRAGHTGRHAQYAGDQFASAGVVVAVWERKADAADDTVDDDEDDWVENVWRKWRTDNAEPIGRGWGDPAVPTRAAKDAMTEHYRAQLAHHFKPIADLDADRRMSDEIIRAMRKSAEVDREAFHEAADHLRHGHVRITPLAHLLDVIADNVDNTPDDVVVAARNLTKIIKEGNP